MTTATPPEPHLGDRLLGLVARWRLKKPGAGFRPRIPALATGIGLTRPWQIFSIAALAGMCGTGVVALLNTPPEELQDTDGLIWTALLFIFVLLLYRSLQRTLLRTTSGAVEQALDRLRARMAEKVARLNLRGFESLPQAQLQGGLAHHYATISEATVGILSGLQAFVLLVLTLGYLATISAIAAILSVLVFGVAVQAYLAKRDELSARMAGAAAAETALSAALAELLGGFKELRLDAAKRAAVLAEIRQQSSRSATERGTTAGIFADVIVFGNSVAYLMGATVVFLLPMLGQAESADIPRMVAVVLFLIGPMGAVVSAAKQLATARFAVNALHAFEATLDRMLSAEPSAEVAAAPPFTSLTARGIAYAHGPRSGDTPFAIGPLDFELAAGEVVFVTGGNGSGKTTALRVLLGLYPADAGEILLNGTRIDTQAPEGEVYRQIFSAVFADVHVFRRAYALPEERLRNLAEALETLQISHKVSVEQLVAGFDPVALSTGQRKRLALAIALAEDRPVLVLDEWAADQDPVSREAFYRQLLPRLRAEGKAVLAITHDDRYFDAADRRYHMEEGRMLQVSGR
jgi:putative ATP-binding cassette transporter